MSFGETVRRLGRRVRLGIVGGGEGSLIGSTHRIAIGFDGHFNLVAGVLSSDPGKSMAQGRELGLERPYGSFGEMLAAEAARDERIDAVAVMTPNDSHYEIVDAALERNFHVICDKPLANTAEEAARLKVKADDRNLILAVTYNYSGYPMVRQARAMIAEGVIGRPHLVEVHLVQGNFGAGIAEADNGVPRSVRWRLDPLRGGAHHLLLDVGVHAHQLACFVLDREFVEVFADMGASLVGRTFDDTATILTRMEGGLRASLLITKAATGALNDFGIQVYGNKGGLRWEQANPNYVELLEPGGKTSIHRSSEKLAPIAKRSVRSLRPHPEGYREAFANIYADFADAVCSQILGEAPVSRSTLPMASMGVSGLRFVEACCRSKADGAWANV